MFKTICICGGGNLGTVIAAIALSKGYNVNLLTGHPQEWNKHIVVKDTFGRIFSGELSIVSNDPSIVIPNSDIIFYCLPGTVIKNYNELIKPWLHKEKPVGSVFCSTGFFPLSEKEFGRNHPLFGTQRVPFICRKDVYGQSATILSYKEEIKLATSNIRDKEELKLFLEDIFLSKITFLSSPLSVTLTNSNPLLHTSRLYSLFKDYMPGISYSKNPLFYGEWDYLSSELLIKMDEEFHKLISKLNIPSGEIIPLLEYYESKDIHQLTQKIKTIISWHDLPSPMIKVDNGWIPDLNSRYFLEEFNYSLKLIYETAKKNLIDIPTIEKIYRWGINLLNLQK